jgi:tol-pal system protein YbgF
VRPTLRHGWAACAAVVALGCALPAQAQLFPDNEARKAIVDLRAKVTEDHERLRAQVAELGKANAELLEQVRQLRLGLVDLNAQIEQLRSEGARLRGQDEQLARDVAELQRRQQDLVQATDERLRRFEPQKVSLDGREFLASPGEQRDYEQAMTTLRGGDFAAAAGAFAGFLQRHPGSGYADSARFWLGNALYGKRDHAGAITVLREFVAKAPDHPRAPEAMLAIANAQIEMKDAKAARTTLTELQKAYPKSEAAVAAKDRLAALR